MSKLSASLIYRALRDGKGVIGINGAGGVGMGFLERLAVALGGKDPAKWPQFRVRDISAGALAAGESRLIKSAGKGREEAFAIALRNVVTWSTSYDVFKGCDLVINATTENFALIKEALVLISQQVDENCPIWVVSSSFPAGRFTDSDEGGVIVNGRRVINVHPNTPLKLNPVAEVGRRDTVDPELVIHTFLFLLGIGMYPIFVTETEGFATNRVLAGVGQALMHLVKTDSGGLASPEQLDTRTQAVLGSEFFGTVADRLGGTAIFPHLLSALASYFGDWGTPTQVLLDQVAAKKPWIGAGYAAATTEGWEAVADRAIQATLINGTVDTVGEGITTIDVLDQAMQTCFRFPSVVKMIRKLGGMHAAVALVTRYAQENPGFKISNHLLAAAQNSDWLPVRTRNVMTEVVEGVAIHVITRPTEGNCLRPETTSDLLDAIKEGNDNDDVVAHVITGAVLFSAGAPLPMIQALLKALPSDPSGKEIEGLINEGKKRFDTIARSKKPIVSAMHMVAVAGGFELALHTKARVATKRCDVGLVEPNVGVIGGWRGNNSVLRLVEPDQVGFAVTLIRNGMNPPAKDLVASGLIDVATNPGELLTTAVDVALEIARGERTPRNFRTGTIEYPTDLSAPMTPVSPDSLAALDRLLPELCKVGPDQADLLETAAFVEVAKTPNALEGVSAFLEKRAANWGPAQLQ